jgi:hypothetical protein
VCLAVVDPTPLRQLVGSFGNFGVFLLTQVRSHGNSHYRGFPERPSPRPFQRPSARPFRDDGGSAPRPNHPAGVNSHAAHLSAPGAAPPGRPRSLRGPLTRVGVGRHGPGPVSPGRRRRSCHPPQHPGVLGSANVPGWPRREAVRRPGRFRGSHSGHHKRRSAGHRRRGLFGRGARQVRSDERPDSGPLPPSREVGRVRGESGRRRRRHGRRRNDRGRPRGRRVRRAGGFGRPGGGVRGCRRDNAARPAGAGSRPDAGRHHSGSRTAASGRGSGRGTRHPALHDRRAARGAGDGVRAARAAARRAQHDAVPR